MNIEKNTTLVTFTQTSLGKIILLILFAAILFNIHIFPFAWCVTAMIAISLITFFPQYRRWWLILGTLIALEQHLLIQSQLDWRWIRAQYLLYVLHNNYANYLTAEQIKLIYIGFILLLSEIFMFFMRRHPTSFYARHPITITSIILYTLILIASYATLSKFHFILLWAFISVYNHLFLFVGYTLIESTILKHRDYLLDYARYLPVWGFTLLPYGKGSIYLRQVESNTSDAFAVTQLKALKLIFWAFLLSLFLNGVYKMDVYYHIPRLKQIIIAYSQGAHYSVGWAWICLTNRFCLLLLELTVWGHVVVSLCRMCGFRILRNTYRPLQSVTLMEFWGRYNYYFKEVVCDFFYYPAYFRFFKTMPRMRVLFATLSAATFGNIFFHSLVLTPVIMQYGLTNAIKGFSGFMLYAVVLGFGVGFSQLLTLSNPARQMGFFRRYLFSPLFVIGFFMILSIFSERYQSVSLIYNFKFLASLFNISW
jgi:hypothetical protein